MSRPVVSCRLNFAAGSSLAVAGTIQFASSIQTARQQLADTFPGLAVPQAKPLSPGADTQCLLLHMSKGTYLGLTVLPYSC